MKIMKIAFFSFICSAVSFTSFSENFTFKYIEGSKYKILGEVKEKVYYNEEFDHSAEILNKISVSIEQVKDKKGFLVGTFQVSEKATLDDQTYQMKDEEHVSKYWCDEKGSIEIDQKTLYPLTREIPVFPNSEIKIGTSWEAAGEEVHDLKPYGIEDPLHIPVKVNYQYVKNETIGDKKLAIIKIKYTVYREIKELFDVEGAHPLVIIGKVDHTHRWDLEKGRTDSFEESFHFVYSMNNNQVVDFVGTAKAEVIESPEMNKKKIESEIKKAIEDEKIKDATVKSDDSGVTITLEDIHFQPESDALVPAEQEKLKKIAAILSKYPDRDLLISGHTALAGTEAGRQALSEKRAKTVADYLLLLGARKPNQLTYKGYGGRFPVAENKTEAGMKKNRRVEIKILEN
jgi:outer membrane protein OmpA-like peptidoglycan-associated protein